jgi:hypothetical protein
MKTADIRSTMDAYLTKLGFRKGTWIWMPGRLFVPIAGEFKEFRLKSGITRSALSFEMGRIATYAELTGIQPSKARKANGHANEMPAASPV